MIAKLKQAKAIIAVTGFGCIHPPPPPPPLDLRIAYHCRIASWFDIWLSLIFILHAKCTSCQSGKPTEWIFSNADGRSACCQSISDISGCGSVEQGEWEYSEDWVPWINYKLPLIIWSFSWENYTATTESYDRVQIQFLENIPFHNLSLLPCIPIIYSKKENVW